MLARPMDIINAVNFFSILIYCPESLAEDPTIVSYNISKTILQTVTSSAALKSKSGHFSPIVLMLRHAYLGK